MSGTRYYASSRFLPPKVKKHKTVGATRSNQRGSNEICSLLIPVQSTTTKLQGVCNLVYTSTQFVAKETKYVWPDILLFIGKEDHGQKQILSSVQLYSSTIFLNCCQNRCKKNWAQECTYKAFWVHNDLGGCA